jgi:hypothetical protein
LSAAEESGILDSRQPMAFIDAVQLTDAVQNVAWVAVPVLELSIVVLMLRRRLVKTFPVFFAYIVCHIANHLVAAALYGRYALAYFWYFWIFEAVDFFLTLAVIQEIFIVEFNPYDALRNLGLRIFRWSTVILCIFVSVMAVAAPAAETNRQMAAFFVMDRSIYMVELGLMFVLFVFCRLFGMTWRHYVFGTAAGFIIMTSISTAVLAVRTHEGQGGNVWLNLFSPLGFMLTNLIWTSYLASAKSIVPLNIVPRTDQLIAWNRALSAIGERNSQ